MTDLFKDKTPMQPGPNQVMPPPDSMVATSTTLQEFYDSRRADKAMSTHHVNRPRQGRDM